MTDHERIGRIESVQVDGRVFTGTVYHVRRNGWACIEDGSLHVASGPAPCHTVRASANSGPTGTVARATSVYRVTVRTRSLRELSRAT